MKKFLSLLLILAMVLSFAACGNSDKPAGNSDDETYTFIIANLAADSDPLNVGYRNLEKALEEKTDGRIQVEIYSNKAISNSDEEQAEMVRANTIQMTTCPTYIMAAVNEELKDFYIYDVPYVFQSDEDIWNYSDSEIGQEMNARLLEKTGNIKNYGCFGIGWVKIMTAKDAINSPADLKGLKIRTTSSQFYMGVASKLGATPTSVAYGEAFTALQQGTVDGIMTATSLLYSDKFYEIQKSVACIDPYQITHCVLVSNQWVEALPDDLRTIFDECIADAVADLRQLEKQAEIDSKKAIADAGLNVCEYDEATKAEFVDACAPLKTELADLVGGEQVIADAEAWLEQDRANR